MSGFGDALAKQARDGVKPHKVQEILDSMAPEEAAAAEAALRDLTIRPPHLERTFKAVGKPVSRTAVMTWREHNIEG